VTIFAGPGSAARTAHGSRRSRWARTETINKALQPTPDGALGSASRFTSLGPAWLGSDVTHMTNKIITKGKIEARTISYQLIGYGILLFLIAGDEIFDFPHTIFGAPATPINWAEMLIEGMYIVLLGAFTIYLSLHFLERIKFLEGFLPICSYCKKIRKGDEWTSLEKYISNHSEALFSHSLCPDCLKKYYGEYLHHEKDKSPNETTKDET